VLDQLYYLAAVAQKRTDRLAFGDRLSRIVTVLPSILVTFGRAAAGAVHPTDRPAPNRRRLARLP
jgi:hypothetical protein